MQFLCLPDDCVFALRFSLRQVAFKDAEMIEQTRRAFVSGLAISGAFASTSAFSQKAKREAQRELSFVHPKLRPFADVVTDQVGGMQDAMHYTFALWNIMSGFVPPVLAAPSVLRHTAQGRAGRPDVVVNIINAQAGKSKPATLHTNGGGYIGEDCVLPPPWRVSVRQ